MYYLLINSLKGNVVDYHKQLVDEVADKFDLRIEQEINVPAHVTLKYWFTAKDDELLALKILLNEFCRNNKPSRVKLGGFDGFPPNAIFINVVPSDNALKTFRNLVVGLKSLKWMEWDQYDYPNLRFHTTIVVECYDKYNKVYEFLSGREKYFDCWFDNITLIGIENRNREYGRIEILYTFQMKE